MGLFQHTGTNQGRAFKVARARQARETLNRFAEHLSEHGDTSRAAAQIGKAPAYGRVLLQKLRAELGWQAQ